VKENLDAETPLPPSLAGLKDDDPRVRLWRKGINNAQDIYEALVSGGIPAEDARGLLPHQTTTRLHYKTNLRNLQEHAGMRLCTQAQFEWRNVWLQIVDAIRNYDPRRANAERLYNEDTRQWTPDMLPDRWQFETLAGLFRPVCYLTGKCEFNASFDRACSIRERVTTFHTAGIPSSEWDGKNGGLPAHTQPINPLEWLAMHDAAR
jgi:hypothetical protein